MGWTRERDPEIFAEIDRCFSPPGDLSKLPVALRILVVGTNYEIRQLKEQLGDSSGGKTVNYSSSIYQFWHDFLLSDDLINQQKWTIPEKVVTTGSMRSRVHLAETVPVLDKLREIADQLGIQFEVIPPFHR